ncbi:MAG: peptidoglycan-binding protein LysM [Bacteroidota bacterium]
MRLLLISAVTFGSVFFSLWINVKSIFDTEKEEETDLVIVSEISSRPVHIDEKYANMLVLIPKNDKLKCLSPILTKDFVGFKEAIGFRESSGKYDNVSKFGYFGKYQFGKCAMSDLGIYDAEAFLKSAKLQEEAFVALCSLNKYKLRNYLAIYDGKTINGIELTESGMLAASHLLGPGAVIAFIKSDGKNVGKDGLGTSLLEYLEVFKDYDTSVITASSKITLRVS